MVNPGQVFPPCAGPALASRLMAGDSNPLDTLEVGQEPVAHGDLGGGERKHLIVAFPPEDDAERRWWTELVAIRHHRLGQSNRRLFVVGVGHRFRVVIPLFIILPL